MCASSAGPAGACASGLLHGEPVALAQCRGRAGPSLLLRLLRVRAAHSDGPPGRTRPPTPEGCRRRASPWLPYRVNFNRSRVGRNVNPAAGSQAFSTRCVLGYTLHHQGGQGRDTGLNQGAETAWKHAVYGKIDSVRSCAQESAPIGQKICSQRSATEQSGPAGEQILAS